MSSIEAFSQVHFEIDNTIRLIPSAYINEPAMQPLVDTDEELDFLSEIEGLTSSRRSPQLPVPDGLSPSELMSESYGYGWSYINAAFCHTRSSGNRFNGSERGAWYAAYGENATETAHSEVVWHLTRELIATNTFENITSYRELIAGFSTSFYDLNGHEHHNSLSEDADNAYSAGQQIAREVLMSGGNGLLYPSRRYAGGNCLVALRPHIIKNIRQGYEWVMEWQGSEVPNISRK